MAAISRPARPTLAQCERGFVQVRQTRSASYQGCLLHGSAAGSANRLAAANDFHAAAGWAGTRKRPMGMETPNAKMSDRRRNVDMWSPPIFIQPVPRGPSIIRYWYWSHPTVIRITLAAMTFS
jgi:hypothetical protein